MIMEVNGTSSGFSPISPERDVVSLRNLVLKRMNEALLPPPPEI